MIAPVVRRVWTGGTAPPRDAMRDAEFRSIRRQFFREDCRQFAAFWKDLPLDYRRLFWHRARYNAWATLREARRSTAIETAAPIEITGLYWDEERGRLVRVFATGEMVQGREAITDAVCFELHGGPHSGSSHWLREADFRARFTFTGERW